MSTIAVISTEPRPQLGVGVTVTGRANEADARARFEDRGIRVSRMLSTEPGGGMSVCDAILALAHDETATVICVLTDEVPSLQGLGRAIDTAVTNDKTVIVLALGALPRPGTATGAVEGSTLFERFLNRHGAHLAASYGDLLHTAYLFSLVETFPTSANVCLLTGSGGAGIIMADQAEAAGLNVAPISPEGQSRLRELWPLAGVGNPVDTTAQVINDPPMLAEFARVVMAEEKYAATVTFMAGAGLNPNAAAKRRAPLAPVFAEHPDVVNIASMLSLRAVREEFEGDGMPVYEDPADAVKALGAAVKEQRFREARRRLVTQPAAPRAERVDAVPAGPRLRVTTANDLTFGPLTVLELALDADQPVIGTAVGFALASADDALELIRSVRGAAALDGARGQEPLDVTALSAMIASVSATHLEPGKSLALPEVAPLSVASGGGVQYVVGDAWPGLVDGDSHPNPQENS